jgi:hypothetical protein
MNENGRELVESIFREVPERERAQKALAKALVEKAHREAIDQGRLEPLPPAERQTVAHTELPPPQPDSPLFQEWNLYRREVGRLLAEGQEGRFVLIKGEEIVGVWDTEEEAEAVAVRSYRMQPCLIHQVRGREPLIRMSSRLWGCQP